METLIKIKQLSKNFNREKWALKNVTLEISKGDVFGIIGMSGAGKSTFMRLLVGLEKPSSGEIWIDGVEISKLEGKALTVIRRNIGMVFQHFNLLSSLTVAENIAFAMEIHGLYQKDRVDELLDLVGLSEKRNAYPARLSGGEKQRVGIARALVNRPQILLCDEATSALDVKTSRSILDLLLKLNRDLALTIILITHQLEIAKQICSSVGVLSEGELIEEGSAHQVLTTPKNPIAKELIQCWRLFA